MVSELLATNNPPRVIAERMGRWLPSGDASPPLDDWWMLAEAFDCQVCRDTMVPPGKTLEQVVLQHADALLRIDWRAV